MNAPTPFRHRSDHTEVNLITEGVQHRRFNHPQGMVGAGHFFYHAKESAS